MVAMNINQNSFHAKVSLSATRQLTSPLSGGGGGGTPVSTLEVTTAWNWAWAPGWTLSSHSPSCLHLAPQQQRILGRFLLLVVFRLHTDILDLRFTRTRQTDRGVSSLMTATEELVCMYMERKPWIKTQPCSPPPLRAAF